jgi:hypothetical protein
MTFIVVSPDVINGGRSAAFDHTTNGVERNRHEAWIFFSELFARSALQHSDRRMMRHVSDPCPREERGEGF